MEDSLARWTQTHAVAVRRESRAVCVGAGTDMVGELTRLGAPFCGVLVSWRDGTDGLMERMDCWD
jgi:hypothetical protein